MKLRVSLIVSEVTLKCSFEVPEVTGGRRVVASHTVGSELRDGNCCQNTDDRNNDQQLDQGKAFSVSDSVKHSVLLSFDVCSIER